MPNSTYYKSNKFLLSQRVWAKLLTSITLIIALYCFTVNFVNQEKTIYFWDYAIHYGEFIDVTQIATEYPLSIVWQKVIKSVETQDYNLLSAFFLLPFGHISTSRLNFTLAIITIYLLPSYLIFLKVIHLFRRNISPLEHLTISSLYLFSPSILTPILRGQTSACGLVIINLIFYYFFKAVKNKHQLFGNSVAVFPITIIAILLAVLPGLHRWYLILSVSFLLAFFLHNLVLAIQNRTTFQNYKFVMINQLILTSLSVMCFLGYSGSLWKKLILINYSDAFINFRSSNNFFTLANQTLSHLGYIYVILFFWGCYRLLQDKKLKSILLISVPTFLISIILFLRIIQFEIQHYFLIIIPVLLIICIVSTKKVKTSTLVLFFCINAINFVQVYYFTVPVIHRYLPIFSQFETRPLINPDIEKINQILDNFLMTKTPQEKIYVASASSDINDSLLRDYSRYQNQRYLTISNDISYTSLDCYRDPFPTSFINSTYFIVVDPEKNSNPAIQLFRNFILSNPTIYKIQNQYIFSNNANITVYKKTYQPANSQINTLIQNYCPRNLIP